MTDNLIAQIQVNKRSSIPIYRQIEEQIERRIKDGSWCPGTMLPSETALAAHIGISIMTVRQAMSHLVNKGLIYREKGRGTFVSPLPLLHPLQRLNSFSEDMQVRGLSPSSQLLVFETCPAPEFVTSQLGCVSGQQLLHIKRLRLADERPVAVHDAYLTRLDIDLPELTKVGSLYQLLEQKGVDLVEAEEHLDAIAANVELAGLLKVPKGAPLLQLIRISWDRQRVPTEFVRAIYRANFYRYTVRLHRDS
jgi:GntR family transcriptional regulator